MLTAMPFNIETLKFLLEAGPAAVYLVFLGVVWITCRRDLKVQREEMKSLVERYEALLRESVTALTEAANALQEGEKHENA